MKNLIMASVIAVTSVFSYSPPLQAASVTVTTSGHAVRRDDRRHYKKRLHRRHHVRDCYIKKTKYRYHGKVIIKKVRICD